MQSYPSWCAEAWVASQIFRNLGFPADDIYFGFIPVIGIGQAVVISLKQEKLEFIWTLVRLDGDQAEVEATWKRFVTDMNAASTDEKKAVSDTAKLWQGFSYMTVWTALRNKGFRVPAFADVEKRLAELERTA